MIWYILLLVLGLLIVIGSWKLYCKFILKDTLLDIILENKMLFTKMVLVVWFVITLLVSPMLWGMTTCATRGSVQHMDTQYSWIYQECQAKNAAGSYVNIKLIRGLPTDDSETAQ